MIDQASMKILLLSRYGRLGASSRLRTMQYVPFLNSTGISVETAPLLNDAFLTSTRRGLRLKIAVRSYFDRIVRLLRASAYDLLWLEYELLPWVPRPFEKLLAQARTPLVVDYDDAIFHRYDMHRNLVVRRALGGKIRSVMAESTVVIAGNQYLADYASRAGAPRIVTIPTVVDGEAYSVSRNHSDGSPVTIGWIGSPSTWSQYMLPMLSTFLGVAEEYAANIRVVGAASSAPAAPRLQTVPWHESDEVSLIQGMDIGVMPLDDTPWSRGKCGYKIIQYMACGLPVVASPVGANSTIVEHGVNGFLASTAAEWREALSLLLRDRELRERMGRAGRVKVERCYTTQVWAPRLADVLRNAGDPSLVQQSSRPKTSCE